MKNKERFALSLTGNEDQWEKSDIISQAIQASTRAWKEEQNQKRVSFEVWWESDVADGNVLANLQEQYDYGYSAGYKAGLKSASFVCNSDPW